MADLCIGKNLAGNANIKLKKARINERIKDLTSLLAFAYEVVNTTLGINCLSRGTRTSQ